MSSELRKVLLAECQKELQSKIDVLQSEFRVYRDSAANETKSTAGDKHDTSKSMMQLEQEKMGKQLNELLQQQKILNSIEIESKSKHIGLGSIITTDQNSFFLSIFSKPIQFESKNYLPVSLLSPIGKLLHKTQIGSVIEFNGKRYRILSIS